MIKPLGNLMKPMWIKTWIPALALLLVLGCGEEPDRKIEGAIDLSEIETPGILLSNLRDFVVPVPSVLYVESDEPFSFSGMTRATSITTSPLSRFTRRTP